MAAFTEDADARVIAQHAAGQRDRAAALQTMLPNERELHLPEALVM